MKDVCTLLRLFHIFFRLVCFMFTLATAEPVCMLNRCSTCFAHRCTFTCIWCAGCVFGRFYTSSFALCNSSAKRRKDYMYTCIYSKRNGTCCCCRRCCCCVCEAKRLPCGYCRPGLLRTFFWFSFVQFVYFIIPLWSLAWLLFLYAFLCARCVTCVCASVYRKSLKVCGSSAWWCTLNGTTEFTRWRN